MLRSGAFAVNVSRESSSHSVSPVSSEPYRDTRGPGHSGVRLLLERLATPRDAKGTRDTAIVRLLYDLGLRRGEVVSLRVTDVDLEAGTVAVMGKDRTERVPLTLPRKTREARARGWPCGERNRGPCS